MNDSFLRELRAKLEVHPERMHYRSPGWSRRMCVRHEAAIAPVMLNGRP